MCATKQVGLALGTDAWTTDPEQIKKQEELLKVAKKYGVSILDTARLYVSKEKASAAGPILTRHLRLVVRPRAPLVKCPPPKVSRYLPSYQADSRQTVPRRLVF